MSETSSSPNACVSGRPKKELPQHIADGLHDILHNPPDLAAQRLLLFEQAQPITMPMEEFATYWPYVSNVWKYVNKRTRQDDGTLVEYYEIFRRRLQQPMRQCGPAETAANVAAR